MRALIWLVPLLLLALLVGGNIATWQNAETLTDSLAANQCREFATRSTQDIQSLLEERASDVAHVVAAVGVPGAGGRAAAFTADATSILSRHPEYAHIALWDDAGTLVHRIPGAALAADDARSASWTPVEQALVRRTISQGRRCVSVPFVLAQDVLGIAYADPVRAAAPGEGRDPQPVAAVSGAFVIQPVVDRWVGRSRCDEIGLRVSVDGAALLTTVADAEAVKAMTLQARRTVEIFGSQWEFETGVLPGGRIGGLRAGNAWRLVLGIGLSLLASLTLALAIGMIARLRSNRSILAESREHLATTLNSIGDAVIATDADGRIENMNPVASQLTGWRIEECLGRPIRDVLRVVDPLTQAPVDGPVDAVLRGDSVCRMGGSLTLIARDGTRRRIADSGAPIRKDDGTTVGVVVVFRDVSFEHEQERRLAESEERLRLALEGARDGVWDWDASGRHVTTNDALLAMLAYTGDTGAGSVDAWFERVHPDDRADLRRQLEEHLAGRAEACAAEFRLRTGAGEHRWVLGRGRVTARAADGRPLRMAGTLRDIHEQRQVQEALARSEARFRSIVEDQTEFIIRWKPDGELTFVNDSFCRYCERSSAALLGEDFLAGIHADDLPNVRAKLRRLSREQPVLTDVRRAKRPDGGVAWQEWTDRALFGAAGEIAEIQSVGRDITERRELEDQLRHAQKMEAVGRLAGGVAHDFNNILTAILGNAELLRDALQRRGILDETAREELALIERSGERAARLTRQLLAFSRRQVIQPRRISATRAVADMKKILPRVVRENIRIDYELAEDTSPIYVDVGQLEQVIVNLVVNATDAMPEGGTLTIRTAHVDIDAEAAERLPEAVPGPHALIEIRDTGTGMDESVRAHIFEPFFTTKPVGRGTGLGLAMVHGIVRQCGGHIVVHSTPGQGTSFQLFIPCAGGEEDEPGPEERSPATLRGHETILICEDDATVRELTCRTLEARGYRVLAAADAHRALAMASDRSMHVDLLISDVVLPGMNGAQLAQRLSRRQPGMDILFISGYPPDVLDEQGVRVESAELLEKPFSSTELAQRVRALLDRRRDRAVAGAESQQ